MAGIRESADIDPAGTAAVGSSPGFGRSAGWPRNGCLGDGDRGAGRLTGVQLRNQGHPGRTRAADGRTLRGFLDALGDALEHNRIPAVNLAAVATVGGGAAIPLVTQRLSEEPGPGDHHATPRTQRVGRRRGDRGPRRRAGCADRHGGGCGADAPTGLAPAAGGRGGAAATESATDGSPSATFRALAWSQDDAPGDEPTPYSGRGLHLRLRPADRRAGHDGCRADGGVRLPGCRDHIGRRGRTAVVSPPATAVRAGGGGGRGGGRRSGDHADERRQHTVDDHDPGDQTR